MINNLCSSGQSHVPGGSCHSSPSPATPGLADTVPPKRLVKGTCWPRTSFLSALFLWAWSAAGSAPRLSLARLPSLSVLVVCNQTLKVTSPWKGLLQRNEQWYPNLSTSSRGPGGMPGRHAEGRASEVSSSRAPPPSLADSSASGWGSGGL